MEMWKATGRIGLEMRISRSFYVNFECEYVSLETVEYPDGGVI